MLKTLYRIGHKELMTKNKKLIGHKANRIKLDPLALQEGKLKNWRPLKSYSIG